MKMNMCWASVTLFHLWQFVHWLAEEIISYSSAAILVALVLSYLAIMCHISNNMLTKFTSVVSTTRCMYTCPVLSAMHLRPPPEVVWVIWFKLVSKSVSEGIYTWSFHDLIAIQSEKCMKWPGVNRPFDSKGSPHSLPNFIPESKPLLFSRRSVPHNLSFWDWK